MLVATYVGGIELDVKFVDSLAVRGERVGVDDVAGVGLLELDAGLMLESLRRVSE